ncbi:MAG TPA: PCYCGC motif-containing (lipo)protein [Anaerolineales bacterium]|nr:PCYCGC motif-containing (lipo)protein [Anaerolineales bacterium]
MRKILPLLVIFSILIVTSSSCSTAEESDLHMMSIDAMPMGVRSAPMTVQQAYQFAAANPDVTQHIPCYCGCGNIGHTSNYSCYVSQVDEKGGITFDNHALGCSICVDITLDAMRLTREGKSPPEIKAYVDTTYAKYGTSNMP